MTPLQKRCQELLPVIQAGAEGKTIQFMPSSREKWHDLSSDITHFSMKECATYRIKPDPKYRPFTPEEAVMQSGSKLLNKRHGHQAELTASSLMTVWINECASVPFETLLRDWTFADGTPCGVLIEDT